MTRGIDWRPNTYPGLATVMTSQNTPCPLLTKFTIIKCNLQSLMLMPIVMWNMIGTGRGVTIQAQLTIIQVELVLMQNFRHYPNKVHCFCSVISHSKCCRGKQNGNCRWQDLSLFAYCALYSNKIISTIHAKLQNVYKHEKWQEVSQTLKYVGRGIQNFRSSLWTPCVMNTMCHEQGTSVQLV